MNNTSWKLRRLCVMAMLCAMAFAAVALVRIPVVLFLKYEPKDVLLTIGGFLFGPVAGAIMSATVAVVELSISDTGVIGLIMNILSSCLFVCTASAIYHGGKSLKRAIIGLFCGALVATAGMLLWNYLITPLYMEGVTRQQIAGMLIPIFLPFNLLKTGLNATLTMLLYKSAASALRAARLLPPAEVATGRKSHRLVWIVPLFILLTLTMVLLAWKGII